MFHSAKKNDCRVLCAIFLSFVVVSIPSFCFANPKASVLLLAEPESNPTAMEVSSVLEAHLRPVDVVVEIATEQDLPTDLSQWMETASSLSKKSPGVLAVAGWKCDTNRQCELAIYETQGEGFVVIPVDFEVDAEPNEDQPARTRGFAIAAAIREAVVGELLLEMNRVSKEAAFPQDPSPSTKRVPAPKESSSESSQMPPRKVFWFEGGYAGEFPYPSSSTMNGVFLGGALYVSKHVVPALSTGWLGIQNEQNEFGKVTSHRWPLSFSIRITFPVGPALFAIAPVGRMDFVYASASESTDGMDSKAFGFEVHAGGMTTWNLPLPGGRLEFIVGAGILATIVGQDYMSTSRRTISASSFRVLWNFGFTWTTKN